MNKYFSILFFSIVICYSNAIHGQIPVTDSIRFNYYSSASLNDFTNHFMGGVGLTPIPDSGITGGCLRTPPTISWGNDNAVYCSKIIAITGDYCQLSVCFLFDTATLNNINFDRTASLWFNPSADWNHYFIAECNPNGIRTTTYYSVKNGVGYNLIHNHWYMLNAGFVFTAASPGYLVGLLDLGTTGNSDSLVDYISFNETDSVIAFDPAITVSLTGTSYGGAKYIDNFSFYGDTAYSNCINTSIASIADQPVDVQIANSNILIQSVDSPFSADVFNLSGQLIFSIDHSYYFEKDFSNLSKGIYVLKVRTMGATRAYKFVAWR